MDIRYKREMNHNYLIMKAPQQMGMENYQLRMMTENNIEGLLKLYVRYVDTEKEYYYEISSKQPLSRLLEIKKITREEISSLLISISSILTRMESYLLDEKQILIEPEYIYIEPSDFSIYLCCVPGFLGDFSEAVRKLLQYLLDKVDYQNRESIALVYHLYQESLNDNYQMEDLLSLIPKLSMEDKNLSSIMTDDNCLDSPKKENIYHRIMEKEQELELELEQEQEISRFRQFTLWFKALFGINKSENQQIYSYVKEENDVYHVNKPIDDLQSLGVTTFLSDLEVREGKKILLKSTSPSSYEDISIEKIPFVIGKNKNGVNYTISAAAVSRFHVRIDSHKGGYVITDLNSTNGTRINGHLLDANETMDLKQGDKVTIAGIEYSFYYYPNM